MTCDFCEEAKAQGLECGLCAFQPELSGLILTLFVPAEGSVRHLWLQADWYERQQSISRILGVAELAMHVLEEDDSVQLLAYFDGEQADDEPNWRLGRPVCGDAVVTMLQLASGMEVSLPRRAFSIVR